jgi:hypothetical protein
MTAQRTPVQQLQNTPYHELYHTQNHTASKQYGKYYFIVNGDTFEYASADSQSPFELVSSRVEPFLIIMQINYTRMSWYLRWIVPSMSDVFTFTLVLCQVLAVLEAVFDSRASPLHVCVHTFIQSVHWLQLFWHTLWTVFKYNLVHLLVWLVIVCVCDLRSSVCCTWLCAPIMSLWRQAAIIGCVWTGAGLAGQLAAQPVHVTLVFLTTQLVRVHDYPPNTHQL